MPKILKNKKRDNLYPFFLLLVYFILFPYVFNSTIEEVHKAIQEVAYSYYMRGKNIQYNDKKFNFFPPEDATQQNVNYLVCSLFTRTMFVELLNITIPGSSSTLLTYSSDNEGSPEVIAYSKINSKNDLEMHLYSPGVNGNISKVFNPSLHTDIIPIIEIGDVLTYTGHALLIYDIIRDIDGKPIDAILMESTSGSNSYVNSKIAKKVKLPSGNEFGNILDFLFLDNKLNTKFKEGLIQGTVNINFLSSQTYWKNINNTQLRRNEYSILRFIQKDSFGNAILKYKTIYKPSKYLPNDLFNDQAIILSKRILDRMKFHHLYIEKIVNKFNGGIVEIGDILAYSIIIKNGGDLDYNQDLIIIENISQYVTYEAHYENKTIISFKYELNSNTLIWNIGKLKKGEQIIVSYFAKVTSGKSGDIIESSGMVGNIPSSTIKNIIGINLDNKKKDLIKKKFEKLKKKYNGKKLINEIYKQLFDINMKFDEFDITKLIINSKLNETAQNSIYLNKNNTFYYAILHKYWSSLATTEYEYVNGGGKVNIYDLKFFGYYNDPERRQDFIYLETFKTGDILIYKNENDVVYDFDNNNNLIKKYITYENGEYAYIFIEGKGFVGVNLGKDKNNNRNEFKAKYYKDNNLDLHLPISNRSEEFLEMANLQTLFGKDYYIILRPSLIFDFKYNDQSWIKVIILTITIIIFLLIISIGLILLRKVSKNSLENKDENLLSKELLNN